MQHRFRYQRRLKSAPSENLPREIDDIADPNVFDHVGRLHATRDLREQLVIGFGVLALENWCGAEPGISGGCLEFKIRQRTFELWS